jgi:hypothetical protein
VRVRTCSRVQSNRTPTAKAQIRNEAAWARAIGLTILHVVGHKGNGFQGLRDDTVACRIQALDGENLRTFGDAICLRRRYTRYMSPVTTQVRGDAFPGGVDEKARTCNTVSNRNAGRELDDVRLSKSGLSTSTPPSMM